MENTTDECIRRSESGLCWATTVRTRQREVDIDLIVPHDRSLRLPVLLELDQPIVSEFIDVFKHFWWVSIDEPGEFSNAFRLVLDDRL